MIIGKQKSEKNKESLPYEKHYYIVKNVKVKGF